MVLALIDGSNIAPIIVIFAAVPCALWLFVASALHMRLTA